MRIVTPNPFKPVRYGFLLVIAIFVYGVAGYVFISILLDYGVSTVYSLLIVTICVFVISWLLHKGVEIPAQAIGRHLSQISR